MEANTTICKVKEEHSKTCANGRLIKLDEDKNTMQKTQSLKENMIDEEEEGLELATPKTKTSFNDVSNTPKKLALLSIFDIEKDKKK